MAEEPIGKVVGGASQDASPISPDVSVMKTGRLTIFVKNEHTRQLIRRSIDFWYRHFPDEAKRFGEQVKLRRDNTLRPGTFESIAYMDPEKTMSYDMDIPGRLYQSLTVIFHKEWTKDPDIYPIFRKEFREGRYASWLKGQNANR